MTFMKFLPTTKRFCRHLRDGPRAGAQLGDAPRRQGGVLEGRLHHVPHQVSSSPGMITRYMIMSPNRGSTGETEWSKCSAEVLSKGDGHECLLTEESQASDELGLDENLLPGQIWCAAAQCQVLIVQDQ